LKFNYNITFDVQNIQLARNGQSDIWVSLDDQYNSIIRQYNIMYVTKCLSEGRFVVQHFTLIARICDH